MSSLVFLAEELLTVAAWALVVAWSMSYCSCQRFLSSFYHSLKHRHIVSLHPLAIAPVPHMPKAATQTFPLFKTRQGFLGSMGAG